MSAKHTQNKEPCVDAVVHACPRATWNPSTQLPFCDKTIRKVFATDCYDFDPEHPWRFQATLQKVFLPDDVKQHKLSMAKLPLEQHPQPSWNRPVLGEALGILHIHPIGMYPEPS